MADSGNKQRQQEMAFRFWYNDVAKRFGLPPDPDDPRHIFDYRAAFEEGKTKVGEGGELEAKFRTASHPQRFRKTEAGSWYDTAEDKKMPDNVSALLQWAKNQEQEQARKQMEMQKRMQMQMQQQPGNAQRMRPPQQGGGNGAMRQMLQKALMQKMGQRSTPNQMRRPNA